MPLTSGLSLLFINQHYHPDIAATGQNLTDLTEYLADQGYTIEIWCGRGRYVAGKLVAPARESRNGVAVRRFRTTAFGRGSHAGRVTDYALFYAQVSIRLLISGSYGGVVFLTTPPLLSFLGFLLRHLRGQRYAIWSMDLHPEAEIAAGMLQQGKLLTRFLHGLNTRGYRNADFVIALGSYMKRNIVAKGVDVDRVHTVCMWSRAEEIEPVPREVNPLEAELHAGGRSIVSYSGNAGIAHRFEEILDAMRCLKHDNRFFFLFIGAGPKQAAIEAYAAEHTIQNFIYKDYFPREQLRYSLSLADIHLVSLRREFAGIAVPAKLYGIMAAARPVIFIGPEECETAEAILQARCGKVIDPYRDPSPTRTLVGTLEAWMGDPAARRELGERGRQTFLEKYERKRSCAAFERVLSQTWGLQSPVSPSPSG